MQRENFKVSCWIVLVILMTLFSSTYSGANSAINKQAVNFYYYLSEPGEDIDRLEFKEISLEAVARIQSNRFHSILNEMPALNNMNKEDLSEKWRAVQHAICNPCTL